MGNLRKLLSCESFRTTLCDNHYYVNQHTGHVHCRFQGYALLGVCMIFPFICARKCLTFVLRGKHSQNMV